MPFQRVLFEHQNRRIMIQNSKGGECLTLALCESRHAYPEWITGSIFPEKILDPTDISEKDEFYPLLHEGGYM